MKHIRQIAFCLALMLALTGMGGVVYAENEPDALSGGSTDPPEEAAVETVEEETEEETEEISEASDLVSEEPPEPTETTEPTETPEPEEASTSEEPFEAIAVDGDGEPNLSQISVTWSEDPVQFIVTDAQRWNAEDLCWETDPERNGEITLVEGSNVKTFTVTNSSDKALTVSVTFTPDESLPEALKNACADVILSCDTIPANGEASGTATVNFDFTDVRLTDDTVTGGTLGSFTLTFTPEVTA